MKLLICTQVIDQNHPVLGFFHRWVEEFACHFAEVHVICLEKGTYELPGNVYIYSLGKERGYSKIRQGLNFYRFFSYIFLRHRPRYVFFHMGAIYNLLSAPYFLVRKLIGAEFYWWKTHGKFDPKAKLVLAFTDRVYSATAESFNFQTNKKFVIGHAIDTTNFKKPARRSPSRNMAIAVGRVVPIKKLELSIEIIKQLHRDGYLMHLNIIGPYEEDEYYASLQKQIHENQLAEYITFVGPVRYSQLSEYFQAASVLLHPSFEAGMDKVVLEAMLSGIIPLTSIPSYRKMLEPFGLYIEAKDVQSYVTRFEAIITNNETSDRMAVEKLRAVVEENHSVSTLSNRLFNIKDQ